MNQENAGSAQTLPAFSISWRTVLQHKKRMHFRTLTPDRYVFALWYNFLNQQLIQFRLLNRQRCFKGLLSQ